MTRASMPAYLFHETTREFVGEGVAWASPAPEEAGVFHMPANSTATRPPAVEERQAPMWRGSEWAIVPDLRGTTAYDTTTGAAAIVQEIGPLPASLTAEPRPSVAHVFAAGAWREDPARMAELVTRTRRDARVIADGFAESARLRFITGGNGQALVYGEKRAEAERYLALEQEPEEFSAFPLIQAEVLRTMMLARSIAAAWAAKADAWRRIAAAIETIRLDAHDAIEAAPDLAAIEAAITTATAAFDKVGA